MSRTINGSRTWAQETAAARVRQAERWLANERRKQKRQATLAAKRTARG